MSTKCSQTFVIFDQDLMNQELLHCCSHLSDNWTLALQQPLNFEIFFKYFEIVESPRKHIR
jgi:hypothetical protein